MAQITVTNGNIVFDCPQDDTILRAALRQGFGFPYECNVGSCGNCRFELVEGTVEHERQNPPALTERDIQRKRWLGCQAKALTDCKIKVSFRDHYKSRHLPTKTRARLTEIEDITHDIREFRFTLADKVPFLPGQYALLAIAGVVGNRAYSMSNVTEVGDEWHFQIKRVPGGAATNRLFDEVRIGDEIAVDGPYGMAYLREDAPRDILCLAGGSGLSPMISITRAAAVNPQLKDRQIHFIYGGRAARDICGEPMLRCLPGFGERIHYHPAVSPGGTSEHDDPPWGGRVGFVPDVAREIFGETLPQFEIYFAGPPAMAEAVMRMVVEMKIPPAQVHYDQFY